MEYYYYWKGEKIPITRDGQAEYFLRGMPEIYNIYEERILIKIVRSPRRQVYNSFQTTATERIFWNSRADFENKYRRLYDFLNTRRGIGIRY